MEPITDFGFLENKPFQDVAKQLIDNYCLQKTITLRGEKETYLYKFLELESYLFNNGKGDLNTICRDCEKGELFIHDFGIDISYETKRDGDDFLKFGGILIRAVAVYKKEGNKWPLVKYVGGPILTKREILYHVKEMPVITKLPEELAINNEIIMTKRIGFEDKSESMNRAFIENIKWKENSEQILKKKKTDGQYHFLLRKGTRGYNPKIRENEEKKHQS